MRGRGVDAYEVNALLPGERPPGEQSAFQLTKSRSFNTLLVSRLVGVKRVSRYILAYQVGVVETKLVDTGTGQPFWSAALCC